MSDIKTVDLEIIPCYKSKNCTKNFQCGTTECGPSQDSQKTCTESTECNNTDNITIECKDGSCNYENTCSTNNDCVTSLGYQCNTSTNTCDLSLQCSVSYKGKIINQGYSGICWGYDTNNCDGVLSCCDPNAFSNKNINNLGLPYDDYDAQFYCDNNDNGYGHNNGYMGCKINDSKTTEYTPNTEACPLGDLSRCMEFSRSDDVIVNECQELCWDNGGRNIIDQKCSNFFKSKEKCNSLPYFCEWDTDLLDEWGKNGLCTAVETDPLDKFINDTGIYPPKKSVVNYKKDCTGTDNCVEKEDIPNGETYKVTCSQSAWDSLQQTSYDPRTRICCLTIKNSQNIQTDKKCITTPRCQFVEESCDCGSRDDSWMCTHITKSEQITDDATTNTDYILKNGYCTWCQGQSQTPQELKPEFEPQSQNTIESGTILQRQGGEWLENDECVNRCEKYNTCEVRNIDIDINGYTLRGDSEDLWNNCIWEESGNKLGVNPDELYKIEEGTNKLIFKNNKQETRNILQSYVPCSNTLDTENCEMMELEVRKTCDIKLQNYGSITGATTTDPSGRTSPPCTWDYTWYHSYTDSLRDTNVPFSQNYLCTWCPSLQCKKGRRLDICSNQDDDSDIYITQPCTDNDYRFGMCKEGDTEKQIFISPTCTTNECYGDVLERPYGLQWNNTLNEDEDNDGQCGCYETPKGPCPNKTDSNTSEASITPVVIGIASGISVLVVVGVVVGFVVIPYVKKKGSNPTPTQ
jgi:hypothetical protein